MLGIGVDSLSLDISYYYLFFDLSQTHLNGTKRAASLTQRFFNPGQKLFIFEITIKHWWKICQML